MKNWPLIAERRRFRVPLIDIWRELVAGPGAEAIPYKIFTAHVRKVGEAMDFRGDGPPAGNAETRSSEVGMELGTPAAVSPPLTQEEKFRRAREARQQEEGERARKAALASRSGSESEMVDGAEVWMTILGEQRFLQLVDLNLRLRSGQVARADAEPILEAAKREAWSKRLGIRAEQLTEEHMNGPW